MKCSIKSFISLGFVVASVGVWVDWTWKCAVGRRSTMMTGVEIFMVVRRITICRAAGGI